MIQKAVIQKFQLALQLLNGSLNVTMAYLAIKGSLALKYNMHVSKIKEE